MQAIHKISLVLKDAVLRKRILFTIFFLAVFRLLANIPIPGVDRSSLSDFLAQGSLFGYLDIFAGGGLSQLSIVMLGVGPYITASIVLQLLTVVVPKIKQMYTEEGDAGRLRFAQYSRILTVPLAIIQAFAFLTLFIRSGAIAPMSGMDLVVNIILVTAGSMILMWIGELITEFGIGNGVSMIIFAGIVSRLPYVASTFFGATAISTDIPKYIGFAIIALLVIAIVVYVTEAERPIQVTYARRMPGVASAPTSYVPLRLNQAGVMPIIFAISILMFPQLLAEVLSKAGNPSVANAALWLNTFLTDPWVNGIIYFLLVFVFTYFYTAVTFDPKSMSDHLQRSGAFIPGVRPGEATATHVSRVLTRITLVGALFLGIIAVLPAIFQAFTHQQSLALGGTALLIVVSVVIDLLKRLDAQVSMREY